MSERAIIQDRLRKKEHEIQTLEEKLRTARTYVHALQDILKMLSKVEPETANEATLRPGSAVSQARDAIFRSGAPVHITDLLEALGKEATREVRASLTSSLAAYVRRNEIFTRPAPNTFGLIELGHTTAFGEEEHVPPQGFGRSIGDDTPF